MHKENSKFIRGLFDLVELYHKEMGARQAAFYRVVQLPTKEDPHVYFQVSGKGIGGKQLPEEIMRGDLLLGFSKADIALIAHLGTKKELSEVHAEQKTKLFARIAQQLFNKGGKSKFLLKFPEQEHLVEAVPEEIMVNHEALNMLEGKDAAMIGYAAAENRLMEIRKQTNPAPTCQILHHDFIENKATYLDSERTAKHTLPVVDVFYNKDLLSLFNKLDQQLISFVAGEVHQKVVSSKKAIRLQLISYANDMAEYQNEAGAIEKQSFIKLAFEPDLLNQFSQKDRDMIRFAAGEFSKEKEIATRNKKNA